MDARMDALDASRVNSGDGAAGGRVEGVTLVLTHSFDPTADYVVEELNRRGAPVFAVIQASSRNGSIWQRVWRAKVVRLGGRGVCGCLIVN
jgi:hypothetical protein